MIADPVSVVSLGGFSILRDGVSCFPPPACLWCTRLDDVSAIDTSVPFESPGIGLDDTVCDLRKNFVNAFGDGPGKGFGIDVGPGQYRKVP